MVGFINSAPSGGDYEPTPAGQHIMICSRVIDLGTQKGSAIYPDPKRKVRLYWELPELPPVEWEDNGVKKSGPTIHVATYTVSFHEKSNLRKMLESWRGKPFTDADFSGSAEGGGFHMRKLLGKPALGQITHDVKEQKTYANLQTIMQLPNAKDWLNKCTEQVFFSFDEYEQETFNNLHDRVKNVLMESPEYKAMHGDGQHHQQDVQHVQQQQPQQAAQHSHQPQQQYSETNPPPGEYDGMDF